MKKWLLLTFISTSVFAAKIPLLAFDQSKLENLLRTIPSSLVRVENHEDFVRKFHKFPQAMSAGFMITCHADYYRSSPIPSFSTCDLEVDKDGPKGDEFAFKVTDLDVVSKLFAAIPYSDKTKKFYAGEFFDGVAHTGAFQNIFRYSFVCGPAACDVTFTTKENPEE